MSAQLIQVIYRVRRLPGVSADQHMFIDSRRREIMQNAQSEGIEMVIRPAKSLAVWTNVHELESGRAQSELLARKQRLRNRTRGSLVVSPPQPQVFTKELTRAEVKRLIGVFHRQGNRDKAIFFLFLKNMVNFDTDIVIYRSLWENVEEPCSKRKQEAQN